MSAFQRIARSCLYEISAHHAGALKGDAEAIHRIRIAIRRLRAATSFFSDMITDEMWRRLKKKFRWLNERLGASRDFDVLALTLERAHDHLAGTLALRQVIAKERNSRHRRLAKALGSGRYDQLMTAAEEWIERGPWTSRPGKRCDRLRSAPVGPYCFDQMARWQKNLTKSRRDASDMRASRSHRLRRRTKRLQYMLQNFASILSIAHPRRVHRIEKHARDLQRALGDLRDLQRLQDVVMSLGRSPGKPSRAALPARYDERRSRLLSEALRSYQKLSCSRRV